MLDIKLNEEQISKIKIISKEYSELRKRYHDLIKDIKKELNVPEKYPILGFLYYSVIEGRFNNHKKVEKCRLAYLDGYRFRRFDDISISEYFEFNPVFRAVSKDGKPGNYIYIERVPLILNDVDFEPFDGTIEEARKILKESKKSSTSKNKQK